MQPQAFYRVVADDFTAVDGIIRRQLASRVPLVEKIGDYITSAGGKRLRPLLVLLAGNALGARGEERGECDDGAHCGNPPAPGT